MNAIRPFKVLCVAISALLVPACGFAPTSVFNGFGSDVASVGVPRPAGGPVLVAALPSRGVRGTLAITGSNQGIVTFQTADGISLALDDGLLVNTRGLGQDLMSAEVAKAYAAVSARSGGASYPRIHAYLSGLNKIRYTTFSCEVSVARQSVARQPSPNRGAVRVDENCSTPGQTFNNVYWLLSDGTISRSRQWVSERVGYLELELL